MLLGAKFRTCRRRKASSTFMVERAPRQKLLLMGGKDLQVAIEINEMIVVVNVEVKFYVGFC
jgi:hypothetical protein